MINLTKKSEELLLKIKQEGINTILEIFDTSPDGLPEDEVKKRLDTYGLNEIIHKKRESNLIKLVLGFKNPLIILLMVIAVTALIIKEIETAVIITIMILISVLLTYFQESRSDKAAQKLQEMVSINASIIRKKRSEDKEGTIWEIPIKFLVPGDIIYLSAGNIIPADIRLISSNDLYINQSVLTGESLPVEKQAEKEFNDVKNPLELKNACFMGSYVSSGTAVGIVVATGKDTYLGFITSKIEGEKTITGFDEGVNKFTWLMIRFILIAAPLVFFINGLSKGDWIEAFLFSLAVIVALTPEMLPMIMTVNLATGALELSKKKVIVKKLSSMQNIGAMNILCSDKTGTLTQNRIILERHLDINGQENEEVLNYAYINSFYQTGLKNLLDVAIFEHIDPQISTGIQRKYKKIDEIPFDFNRRCLSVIVEDNNKKRFLICKGAVEELLKISSKIEDINTRKISELNDSNRRELSKLPEDLNKSGFRGLAIAYKEVSENQQEFSVNDEKDLTLIGFVAFFDPPKDVVNKAIAKINQYGVEVKILTGDNELVTDRICKLVGLNNKGTILGNEIDSLSDEKLAKITEKITIFAKLSPLQKERIIKILRKGGNVVGYLGDGINDAPALKAADVGISVNTAVDIAKESADIILLEKSLLVLTNGVIEGRKVFANVMKYIKSRASLNFGSMISIVGASIFLPFLPMLPIQIIVANLLSDFSNIALPTDNVDKEYLLKPRMWQIGNIKKFMLFMGPVASFFDYTVFFVMIFMFNAWTKQSLFQTGWFLEFILAQILMIYIVRTNKISFLQSNPSSQLVLSHLAIIILGIWLPFSPLAQALNFTSPPLLYWILLGLILTGYILFTHFIKNKLDKIRGLS